MQPAKRLARSPVYNSVSRPKPLLSPAAWFWLMYQHSCLMAAFPHGKDVAMILIYWLSVECHASAPCLPLGSTRAMIMRCIQAAVSACARRS